MRIIAGTYRGRRLTPLGKGDDAAHLRPTTDRVRESLFNLLTPYDAIRDAQVLDLFAGTGALGLEALSRGARAITFVENGRKAQSVLQRNIALLAAEDHTKLHKLDATKLPEGTPHDLVFLDPPYGKGFGERAMDRAAQSGWLKDDALIVWEERDAPILPNGFDQLDQRHYGDTLITIARFNAR